MRTICGTPVYMAPEMREGKRYITNKVDIWTLGVLTLQLSHRLPRHCTGSNAVMHHIDSLESHSHDNFIRFLLEPDPWSRPEAQETLGHAIFRQTDSWTDLKLRKWDSEASPVVVEAKEGSDQYTSSVLVGGSAPAENRDATTTGKTQYPPASRRFRKTRESGKRAIGRRQRPPSASKSASSQGSPEPLFSSDGRIKAHLGVGPHRRIFVDCIR
ncbi:kinase-like domain-containing protein [Xylaria curta]|nr:kinase-like domain-containing protein [Xylaria curta]